MALFKIFKGQSSGLPKTYKDGYCYFTTNDGKMYIDTKDSDSTGRIVLNAEKADKLKTARTITLSGNLSGSFNFDGSSNVTIPITVTGAKMTDHLWLTGAVANSSTANTSQIIFGTEDYNHVAISSNDNALIINPTASTTTNQIVLYLNQASVFPAGIKGNLTGNASTASKLGTSTVGAAADRPIYLNAGTATATTYRMAATNTTATSALSIANDLPTGIWYVNGTSGVSDFNQTDGVCIANQYSDKWITEIYQDYRTGQLAIRGKNNGTWQAWRKVLDSTNYTSYAPTKTGSGASGTWGISISGNAATATTASQANRLTTSRTIFGQPFDGSANVVGKPMVYGTYTATAASRYSNSGIEIRENGLVGSAQSDIGYAPSIGFHWGGRIAATMLFHSDGNFYLRKQDGTSRASLDANIIGNASSANYAGYLPTSIAFTPAETAITADSVYTLIGSGGRIKRGTWSYAGNGHISSPFGTIDLAGTTVIQAGNANTQYTQLYITPPTASASGAIKGEMIYYINNGSDYAPTWYRVLTDKNYSSILDSRYINVSGDTMTGALNFANGIWNNVGDDCAIGDYNQAGAIGIKGLNGATGIYFVPYSGSTAQKISIDGAGTMSITGKVSMGTMQVISSGITSTIYSQNSSWLHYTTAASSGHWFNKNVAVQGNIYAGTSYNQLVLHAGNYSSYALPLSGGTMSGSINMNNNSITGINYLEFADPGVGEGITWTGGNGWNIYESPDDLTNSSGNLQFVHGSTRRLTIRTNGTININGTLQMSGAIQTSFKSSTAMGSYQAVATTVPDLVEEIRYSSGAMGSVNITTAYAAGYGGTINGGWYNFIYSPHRSGGSSGAASGDNHNYGTLILSGMTGNLGLWVIRVTSGAIGASRRVWRAGDTVTGAVWNDYAECRESHDDEPGYVLIENGDDTLSKSTERLQQFAGISSDTYGFSQGETEKAKTPIAVAGRVLVYPYQNRNNYKPGDVVCAAPGGTVDIMTDEEIMRYPHRIVGTVSCVPDYEEWGGGEYADRPPVKVNGRIWIKVK